MPDVVFNSCTAANGTLLTAHSGETGGPWLRCVGFGPDVNAEFVIHSNAVRRPTFAENPAADGGEALCYATAVVPGGVTHFQVACDLSFAGNTSSAFLELYAGADIGSNSDILCVIGNPSFGGSDGIQTFNGFTTTTWPFVATIGHVYAVLLDINGVNLTLKLDGVVKATWSKPVQPPQPMGFDLGDLGSEGLASFTNMTISYSSGFWTDLVGTHETL